MEIQLSDENIFIPNGMKKYMYKAASVDFAYDIVFRGYVASTNMFLATNKIKREITKENHKREKEGDCIVRFEYINDLEIYEQGEVFVR